MKTYMNPDWLPVTQWMFTGSKVIVLLSFSHCAKQSRRLFGRAWPLSTWLFLSYVIMSLISLMSWSGVLVLPSVEGGQALGSACLWSLLVSRPSHLKRPVFKDQLKLLLSAKLSYIGYNNQALSRVLWSLVLASLLRWHRLKGSYCQTETVSSGLHSPAQRKGFGKALINTYSYSHVPVHPALCNHNQLIPVRIHSAPAISK